MCVLKTFSKGDSVVNQLSFSHDGAYIAAACEDELQEKQCIDIYEVESGNMLYSYANKELRQTVAWHPSKHILAYAGEDNKEGLVSLLVF